MTAIEVGEGFDNVGSLSKSRTKANVILFKTKSQLMMSKYIGLNNFGNLISVILLPPITSISSNSLLMGLPSLTHISFPHTLTAMNQSGGNIFKNTPSVSSVTLPNYFCAQKPNAIESYTVEWGSYGVNIREIKFTKGVKELGRAFMGV